MTAEERQYKLRLARYQIAIGVFGFPVTFFLWWAVNRLYPLPLGGSVGALIMPTHFIVQGVKQMWKLSKLKP